jgi:flavodoxin I
MKALIVYDSVYGNTEKIAKAIAEAITPSNEVKVLKAGEANPSDLEPLDLLIVGSPTHAGRPVSGIQDFLNKVPEVSVKGKKVAGFDTRTSSKVAKIFGYAAGRIVRDLEKKGGIPVASPGGFLVTGTQGPLKAGELERAATWAKAILETKK